MLKSHYNCLKIVKNVKGLKKNPVNFEKISPQFTVEVGSVETQLYLQHDHIPA